MQRTECASARIVAPPSSNGSRQPLVHNGSLGPMAIRGIVSGLGPASSVPRAGGRDPFSTLPRNPYRIHVLVTPDLEPRSWRDSPPSCQPDAHGSPSPDWPAFLRDAMSPALCLHRPSNGRADGLSARASRASICVADRGPSSNRSAKDRAHWAPRGTGAARHARARPAAARCQTGPWLGPCRAMALELAYRAGPDRTFADAPGCPRIRVSVRSGGRCTEYRTRRYSAIGLGWASPGRDSRGQLGPDRDPNG